MQMQQSEKLAQQLQAQVGAAQSHGEGLHSICDILSKRNEDLTAELSGSKASVEDLQVSFFILAGNAATLQAKPVCTSESVIVGIPCTSSHAGIPPSLLLFCALSLRSPVIESLLLGKVVLV